MTLKEEFVSMLSHVFDEFVHEEDRPRFKETFTAFVENYFVEMAGSTIVHNETLRAAADAGQGDELLNAVRIQQDAGIMHSLGQNHLVKEDTEYPPHIPGVQIGRAILVYRPSKIITQPSQIVTVHE